jgi:hypothetical protein
LRGHISCIHLILAAAVSGAIPARTSAPTVYFVAPPRTITDITAILNQEKPDPKLAAKLRAEADAIPPAADQPGIVAQRFKLATEMMRADTGFHADQARWHVGRACFHLAT